MKYKYQNSRVLIFAREPVLGKVKTRLESELGEAKTFDLHCALIVYQVKQVSHSNLAPMQLWVTANPSHELFRGLVDKTNIFEQRGSDLGQRMLSAAETTLREVKSVVIIGADCPSVDNYYLEQALSLLDQGTDVVLGPAEDGGYVLLGLNQVWPGLFSDIPWGTEQVLESTVQRLRSSGLSFKLLDVRWDVDRPQDLGRLEELQPPLSF